MVIQTNIIVSQCLIPFRVEVTQDEKYSPVFTGGDVKVVHRLIPDSDLGARNVAARRPPVGFTFD